MTLRWSRGWGGDWWVRWGWQMSILHEKSFLKRTHQEADLQSKNWHYRSCVSALHQSAVGSFRHCLQIKRMPNVLWYLIDSGMAPGTLGAECLSNGHSPLPKRHAPLFSPCAPTIPRSSDSSMQQLAWVWAPQQNHPPFRVYPFLMISYENCIHLWPYLDKFLIFLFRAKMDLG